MIESMSTKTYDPPLDPEIAPIVEVLNENGVDTYESCQGGSGHAYFEPTVRFHGDYAEGLRAVSIAIQQGMKVCELRRVYSIQDGELKGPWWELTFAPTKGL